ncbi:MAG: hypothetical protein LUF26_06830 [Firmicutes bacterium]|nr:hypothetical protein [Bacillota bacterium]
MLLDTVYFDGKNKFKDSVFSAAEWSAPAMGSPDEIRKLIDSFSLCGRKIKGVKLVGHSYFQTRDWIEDIAYHILKGTNKDERRRRSRYRFIDPEMRFPRQAATDEPLLIWFEDGGTFEAECPRESQFRMSMNCIPRYIRGGTNEQNVDAEILFSPWINQTIKSVEITTYKTNKDPMYGTAFDEAQSVRELAAEIIIRLENGMGIRLGSMVDYFVIECVDARDQITEISFRKLDEALLNWEDIHNDEETGFEAESHTIFFGEKGERCADTPFMKLQSSGSRSFLSISADDFLVLGWCAARVSGECFDEYGEYHFTAPEWRQILEDAYRLLSFKTLDELINETAAWGIFYRGGENYMRDQMNRFGASFWREREKYFTQLSDLRKWSAPVLGDNDTMDIYGF